jgi:hypothetical protein
MGLPLFDASVRTSQTASGSILVAVAPQGAAAGTGRPIRIRQFAISNTTATAFGVGFGIATNAGTTPGTSAGTPNRRGSSALDPPSTVSGIYTTYATNPAAPSMYSGRLWVPGNSMVVWVFADGDELVVPPASTPIPFCIWNTGTGAVSDISITWEE